MGGWYIKSTYYTRFLNWNKVLEKRVVTSKTPFFVIGPSCAPYSICLNIGSWQGSFVWKFCVFNSPSRQMHLYLWDVSNSVSETSQRGLICKSETSPGRFIKNASSETSLRPHRLFQRCLWVAYETVIPGFQTEACFGNLFIYLQGFKYFAKLI